jgi:sulfur carrier protein ThiS|tara:strand:- start:1935 stop:2186 length:252 start_codon:yes stop_codon:yes gene_type:complete
MKIHVKLVSMPGRQPTGFDNFGNAHLSFSNNMTVSGLLDDMKLSKAETYMVLINGETVPPSIHKEHFLKDSDDVTIFPPMEGG